MRVSPFCAALVFALLVRVAVLPLPGTQDMDPWKIWSYAATQDLTGMFGVGGTPPTRGEVRWGDHVTTVNYPPFFLYEYAVVGYAYGWLFPGFPDGVPLVIAVKLPILAANVGLTWLLFATVRRVSGSVAAARWAALAYCLNPATLFGGEMLGYVDALMSLPAVWSLVLAHDRKAGWAGVLVAISVATKPQGLFIGPALALVLWQTGGLRAMAWAGLACASTLCVLVLPFAVRGAMGNMWLAFGSYYARRDTMSAFAANLGWIVNWFLRSWFAYPELGWRAFLQLVPRPLKISRFQELGFPNPRPFCGAAVALVTLWGMWAASRARDLAMMAALGAFTVHAAFVLNVGMHENHQLLEVPLIVLAAALRPRFRPLALVVSATMALSINILFGIGLGWGWAVPRTVTGLDLSVVLAFVNLASLGWFAALLWRESSRSPLEATR